MLLTLENTDHARASRLLQAGVALLGRAGMRVYTNVCPASPEAGYNHHAWTEWEVEHVSIDWLPSPPR